MLRFYCPPVSLLCYLYVASAAYADHAGTADTAANALKLGGYDATDYMRKDEVKTIKSSYETLEWDGAGTYSWTVPEGVTKINVTTVGGGGGAGYLRVYNSTTKYYYNGFPGGDGGQVKEGIILSVKGGDKVSIIVGKRGYCPQRSDYRSTGYRDYTGPNPNQTGHGRNGSSSYLTINGIKQITTEAQGGAGGSIKVTPYVVNGVTQKDCYNTTRTQSVFSGAGGGATIWYRLGNAGTIWSYNGGDSPYAQGGQVNFSSEIRTFKFTNSNHTNLVEYGAASGGGASYGAGASCYSRSSFIYPKRGGGGASCQDFTDSSIGDGADGYVKISYTRIYSD